MLHSSVELVVETAGDSGHVPMLEESTCLMDMQARCSSSTYAESSLAKSRLSALQAESSIPRSLYCGESSGRDGWASMDVLLETHSKSDADDCKAGLREVDEHRILILPMGKARGEVAGISVTALSEIVGARCSAMAKLYRKKLAFHGDREDLGNQVWVRLPANS